MLHEDQLIYGTVPLGALDTGDTSEEAALASVDNTYSSFHRGVSAREQQQRILCRSMSASGSHIASVRCNSALPVPQGSVGSNPLSPAAPPSPQLPCAPVTAAGAAGWGDYEHSISQPLQQSPQQKQPPEVPLLSATAEDFVHEILAMNTLAMEQCYAAIAATNGAAVVSAAAPNSAPNITSSSEESMRILSEAYMRVDETSAQDFPAPLLDELRTTTLNNMGVVECNRGQPRQALSHFEAARQMEENNGMASPSITLNMCAAYNSLHMFDKATAAALETIDMLRSLALQRRRNLRSTANATALHDGTGLPWNGSGGDFMNGAKDGDTSTTDLLLKAAAAPKIADSHNEALWGAAWNNLAVAQINTARGSKDTSEYTNALSLFQNAMRATQELLGMQHPMSKAVIETFRSVRRALRSHGAFKQHRSLLRAPLPPVDPREQEWEATQVEAMPGHTRHGTLQHQKQQLTITFRGEVTGGQKKVERLDSTPYPGATSEPYQKQPRRCGSSSGRGTTAAATGSRNRSRSGNKRQFKLQSGIAQLMRNLPLSGTLYQASTVYGNPHPLLYSPPPPGQDSEAAPLYFSGSARMVANQYDGVAAAPGCAMSTTDTIGEDRDRGQHRYTTRGRSAATGRTPPSKRQPQQPGATAVTAKGGGRRSKSRAAGNYKLQTVPHPGSSRTYQYDNAVGAATEILSPQSTRPPVSKALPPIDMGASGGGAAAVLGEYSEGYTGASSAAPLGHAAGSFGDMSNKHMATPACTHHRPHRPPKRTPSASHASRSFSPPAGGAHHGAAATTHVQQSKMLLLAAPSNGVTTTTTYYPLEVPSETTANSVNQCGSMPTPATAQPTADDTTDSSADTHELFRGMWVTADPHYLHRGPRVFGRPAYYTIPTALGVTEDGVGGCTNATGTGISAAASTTQTDLAARPVLPTLTYSSSDSEEDNDAEGEGGNGSKGGMCRVTGKHHSTSVSTDTSSPSATPQRNALAETARMTT